MKKLIPAALAFTLLTGCGAQRLTTPSVAPTSGVVAQSKLGVEKALHAVFRAAFKAADKNGDKKLSVEEMPAALPGPSGQSPAAAADAKALFAKLDTNKNGFVGYREFASKDNVANALTIFRVASAHKFADLDVNGDHILTAEELKASPYAIEKFDTSKNGNITQSEFENAFATVESQGPDPVDPNAPPAPPAPPAVDPNTPPAPPAPAVDPNTPPAPVVDPNAPPAPTGK